MLKEQRNAILSVCKEVRKKLLLKHGGDLAGTCIDASEEIHEKLKVLGIKSTIIEGWCHYDDASSCSDRDYDEHTWVECEISGQNIYVDVTADQFSYFIDEEIPPIIVGDKPYYMVYDKPVDTEF